MPFISISSGMVTSRSISSAAWPGHCVMSTTCVRREVRICVDGQFLERHGAPDHERDGTDDDQKTLLQGEGDEFRDHSICALLDAAGELQEEAAIGNDGLARRVVRWRWRSVRSAGRRSQRWRCENFPGSRLHVDDRFVLIVVEHGGNRHHDGIALRIPYESRRQRTYLSSSTPPGLRVTMRTGVVRVLGSRKEPI